MGSRRRLDLPLVRALLACYFCFPSVVSRASCAWFSAIGSFQAVADRREAVDNRERLVDAGEHPPPRGDPFSHAVSLRFGVAVSPSYTVGHFSTAPVTLCPSVSRPLLAPPCPRTQLGERSRSARTVCPTGIGRVRPPAWVGLTGPGTLHRYALLRAAPV
jgi:hypothetical protein